MRLVEIATRRRVTVTMFTLAVLLFGFVSLSRLKVNLLPDLSYPTLTVRVELPGSAPLEVENLVTRPVEEAVGIIRNVRQVRSVSRSGQSDVTLEFAWGTDMDLAGIDVREKLDLLQLPLEAKRPLLLRFDPASEPVMRYALLDAGTGAGKPVRSSEERLKALRRFAEDRLKPDLEAVEGSAAVKVSGGLEEELQVQVDQERLAQLNLGIEVVTGRLRAENVNLSGGRLEQGTQRFLVRTLNEFGSVDEMANAIIATRNGQPVKLRDVATVVEGHKDREAITRVNGSESVELAIYKEGDANTVALAAGITTEVEKLGKLLPPGSRLELVYDQAHFINAAIGEVKESALIGGVLAILVLYFFLRDARATLVTSIAIPVSVIGTFMLMYWAKVSLNIMSLGGIALAVGMLVDNAVVVLEAIVRRREHGMAPAEAARQGTSEVAMAVTAATLTSVAVFFPMVFISGIAGQLFRDQALTVTFSLLLSLLVALTLVPMLAAGNDDKQATDSTTAPPVGRLATGISTMATALRGVAAVISATMARVLAPGVWLMQALYGWAERVYPPAVTWALRHRRTVLGGAAALFVGTMALVPLLGTELIPQMSQGEFNVDVKLASGSPLESTDQAMVAATRAAMALPNLKTAYAVAGTGNRLDANPVDAGENTGRLAITLVSGAGREEEEAAIDKLRHQLASLAGTDYRYSRPSLFSFSAPLEVVLTGYDLERLKSAADQLRATMQADDRFADVKSTMEAGNPEIRIVFSQERAAQLGLPVREIADRVVNAVRGEVATRYTLLDKKIDVLVRSVDTRASSIEEIRNLIVNPGSDRPVPLYAVATVELATGPAEIRRANQERVAVVSANLGKGDLGGAIEGLNMLLSRQPLPPGVAAYVGGQSSELQDSFDSLQFTLVLAVFLVYLVMASQFESLIHPLVILFTIPLSAIGAVWALLLTGTTVNVVAYIGLIMLAGIVVNQSIVLIDAVNQARERGLSRHAAIVEAGRVRLRPILITKLTTILGLLPMALGLGEGAEVRAPMAITVIGGVLLTTFLTLLVIPVVYDVVDRRPAAGA